MTNSLQILCTDNKKSIATAESCTGGNIAHQITLISGSSSYFLGSVVSYDNSVKRDLLNVNPKDLITHGAVSKQVAEQMVRGVLFALKSDFAVATTGIAGPTGGSEEKPVGTVWIGVGNKETQVAHKYVFSGNRSEVIAQSTEQAVKDLYAFVEKHV